MDSSGNLYGTTGQGGASGDGTVFELAKGSSTITTLASFNGSDGDNPRAGLIMDSSGNLYGTTRDGGANGYGTVFELAKGSRHDHHPGVVQPSTNGADPAVRRAGHGQQRQPLWHNLRGVQPGRWHRFRAVRTHARAELELPPPSPTARPSPARNWTPPLPIPAPGQRWPGPSSTRRRPGRFCTVGSQTLSVTFTPTDTTDYSPITTSTTIVVNQATPVLTWNTPAPITYGTPLSSTQLDATAANPNNGSAVSGTFAYTPAGRHDSRPAAAPS